MKRSAAVISDISRITFASAVFCCFFAFFALIAENENAGIALYLPYLVFALVFVCGRLAGRREMVLLKYAAIELVVTAVGLVILQLLVDVPRDAVRFRFLISLCYVIDAVICAKAALSENRLENIVHRFDVCIVMFVIMLLADHYLEVRSFNTALITVLIAFIMLLIAVVRMRTEKNGVSGNRVGAMIPVIIFAVIIGAALLIGIFGQQGAGSAVGALTAAVKAVLAAIAAAASFLWNQWLRFCAWLAGFFRERDVIPIENIENVDEPEYIEPAELTHASVVVAYVLAALAVIAIITAIVMSLRKRRIRKRHITKTGNRIAVRSGSFRESLKAALRSVRLRAEYRICRFRNRNTPAGLLTWCEAKNKRKRGRLPSESGRQFLIRLSETCPDADKDALIRLAGLVEQAFYSPVKPAADEALCRAIRSCKF